MYRVRSKKVVEKKSPLAFTNSSIFRLPQQSHTRHFFKRKKKIALLAIAGASALPTLLRRSEWRERRAQRNGRLHNSDCSLGIQRSSKHMYCICSTQVPVHTEHALLQTDKHPQPRSQSHENEVLTVTWVDGWEKSSSWGGEDGGGRSSVPSWNRKWVVVLPRRLPPSVFSPSRPALACVCALCAARSSSSSLRLQVCYTSLL